MWLYVKELISGFRKLNCVKSKNWLLTRYFNVSQDYQDGTAEGRRGGDGGRRRIGEAARSTAGGAACGGK